jgi:ABC-type sugar transport system permease subunit
MAHLRNGDRRLPPVTEASETAAFRRAIPFPLSAQAQRNITIVAFLVVPVTSLVLFNIYPVAQLFWISLTDFNSINWSRAKFVGLDNYVALFSRDARLLAPMVNSLYYLGGSLVQIALATWFAVTLNDTLPGARFFRTILFLPFVLNAVAAALIFRHVLQLDGTLNDLLEATLGPGAKFQWLDASKNYTNFSLAAASVWRFLGFNLVVTFGVLQSIPSDQYDAARIEGANRWQLFWRITFPSIRLVLLLQLMLSAVGSLEVFEIPQIITMGAGKTATFAIAMVQTGFEFRRAGMAAAMAVLMLLIVAVFFLLVRIVSKGAGALRAGLPS